MDFYKPGSRALAPLLDFSNHGTEEMKISVKVQIVL